MKEPWVWDDKAKRYRDPKTGRFISFDKVAELRDAYIDAKMEKVRALATSLVQGDITLNEWLLNMRRAIKESYIAEYALAVGGIKNLTASDYGRIGAMVKRQYHFLQNFAEDIRKGNLTEGQIAYRAQMYIDSASQAFERGAVAVRGMPNLPAYPGDGQTVCLSNCRCHWEIVETENGWNCFWRLGQAEHCDDCVSNAGRWNPLFVARIK